MKPFLPIRIAIGVTMAILALAAIQPAAAQDRPNILVTFLSPSHENVHE